MKILETKKKETMVYAGITDIMENTLKEIEARNHYFYTFPSIVSWEILLSRYYNNGTFRTEIGSQHSSFSPLGT